MIDQSPVPIAIIGIGCRLPGGVADTEQLWQLLTAGQNAWGPVPANRYNEAAFYHPKPDNGGTTNHRGGHFLSGDIAAFDAAFFGLSPLEARAMDPQQRLLLEINYEALENAGIPVESVKGSKTAVYVALFTHDYDRNIYKDPSEVPKYHVTGCGGAIASNRICYTFDLKGPSMTLDTGCSGSLVALHQACQSLRSGESNMAMASGVSLILSPDHMIAMSNLHMLNDNGKSYAFDTRGNGYGRGEGATCVLLKRLDDALQAGDNIRAVIRNTAINQDGKTNGITSPSQQAQQDLQESIHVSTGVSTQDIDYIEAHGTGTTAGDHAELQAISNVFCSKNKRRGSLLVGSIKSNIGHLESSSGLAGLIKAVLSLEKGLIPPNADFRNLKDSLKVEKRNIKVPTKLEPWPTRASVRRACVNSFGYGGTNAHVILESYPIASSEVEDIGARTAADSHRRLILDDRKYLSSTCQATPTMVDKSCALPTLPPKKRAAQLFVLSASSDDSLPHVAAKLKAWATLRSGRANILEDLAYNLSNRRSMMPWRYGFIADSHKELLVELSKNISANKVCDSRRIVFVFTGQGAQSADMGRELLYTDSKFTESIRKSDSFLRGMGAPWSLMSELQSVSSESRLSQSHIAQPASTAIQIALVDLLAVIGLNPDTVLGHSSGEIGAAYAAGAISHETAMRISYCRSFVSRLARQKVNGSGAMLAVGLSEGAVLPLVAKVCEGALSVACVNSPSSTTVSGDEAAIVELSESLSQIGVFNRRLNVDTAYHSYHMQKVADEYLRSLGEIEQQPLRDNVKFLSTVTAEEKTTEFGSSYWVENLVSKVRFCEALQTYCRRETTSQTPTMTPSTHVIVEIGPHKALNTPIRQTITQGGDSLKHVYLPTLVKGYGAVDSILELARNLFNLGQPVTLSTVNAIQNPRRQFQVLSDLPTYPWDHSKTYWHESRLSKDYRLRTHPPHDLLGVRMTNKTPLEPCWRYSVDLLSLPWLADHMVDGLVIFPGAGYLCMALEALRQCVQESFKYHTICTFQLRRVYFLKALVIPPAPAAVELQLCLRLRLRHPKGSPCYDFRIYAVSQEEGWSQHCHGQIIATLASEPSALCDIDPFVLDQRNFTKRDLQTTSHAECTQTVSSGMLYNQLRSNGNHYGPCFSLIEELSIGEDKAISKMRIPNIQAVMPSKFQQPHVIHPSTLDALLHSIIPLFTKRHGTGSIMPFCIQELNISPNIPNIPGTEFLTTANIFSHGIRSARANFCVFETTKMATEKPALTIYDADIRGLGRAPIDKLELPNTESACYRIEWMPDIDFVSSKSQGVRNRMSAKKFIEYLHFKHPGLAVLEVGNGLGEMSDFIFKELRSQDIKIDSKVLGMNEYSVEQNFEPESFDVVIFNQIIPEQALSKALVNTRRLLKSSGRMVLPQYSTSCADRLDGLLLQHAFRGVELVIDRSEGSLGPHLAIVTRPADADVQRSVPAVQIVTGEDMGSLGLTFVTNLEASCVDASVVPWPTTSSPTREVYLVLDNGQKPVLANPTTLQFQQISYLLGARCDVLWISTQESVTAADNPEKSLITGFARSARAENAGLRLITLDVQEAIGSCWLTLLQVTKYLLASFISTSWDYPTAEMEYVFRDGQLLVPRLLEEGSFRTWISTEANRSITENKPYLQPTSRLFLNLSNASSNNSLNFVHDDISQEPLSASMVEIVTRAHCMSLADAIMPLDSDSESAAPILREFSGFVRAVGSSTRNSLRVGEKVCGWTHETAPYANYTRVESSSICRLSDSTSLVLGATIPVPFMTAYYGLVEVAAIHEKQSILVYRAATDVGTAAIRIATLIGANVFASVSTATERDRLIKSFNLRANCVYLERTADIVQNTLEATDYKGVDIVLNTSGADEAFDCCSCIAQFGTFLQVGGPRYPNSDSSTALPFKKHATIVSFDLPSLVKHRPQKVANLLERVMAFLDYGNYVTTTEQINTFPMSDIRSALQKTSANKEKVKVVLVADEDTHVEVLRARNFSARNEIPSLRSDATYIIAGGLGALGQRLCRFMSRRGAKNIVILSRRTLTQEKERILEHELRLVSSGLRVVPLACDISDNNSVRATISKVEGLGLPPVKGLIHSAAVLQDRALERMTVDDYQAPLRTKVLGTRNLSQALHAYKLDFFIMLSSLSGIVGSRGQANYAAANTFQDAFANSIKNSETKYLALDLGMIEDTDVYSETEGQTRTRNLLRQGWVPIRDEELQGFLGYAFSPQARNTQCRDLITGINGRSIHEAENPTATTKSALFAHVRRSYSSENGRKSANAGGNWQQALAQAHHFDGARQIVATAVGQQLANIVGLDHNKIAQDLPLLNFGLDSLLAVELKNWIAQELSASVQASEILDEPSLMALGTKIALRSTLVAKSTQEDRDTEYSEAIDDPETTSTKSSLTPKAGSLGHVNRASNALPCLPVPDLADTLALYIISAEPFLSSEQWNNTSAIVQDFGEGVGQQLHSRLIDRSSDPQIDNWQYDLQINSIYLRRRDPIHPYGTFFGAHFDSKVPHCQAERAAIISSAAFDFKRRLDALEVGQSYMNEEPLCMDSLQWLFNTSREPGIGIDKVCKYPGNEFVIAMRRGHIFKIQIFENGDTVPFLALEQGFQAILDLPMKEGHGVAALTAQARDTWAEHRKAIMAFNADNAALMAMIEAAAFIICLDEGSPTTPTERYNQFQLGNPRNRWSDKSLQFVVCENGASAYICEHSMLDAASLRQINTHITQAISNHKAEAQTRSLMCSQSQESICKPYHFTVTDSIKACILHTRNHFKTAYTPAEFIHFQIQTLGNELLRNHKIPSKAGLQIIVQLASLIYYGQQYPSWETVTTMPFYKGRLDWMQVVSKPMFDFCKAATDASTPKTELQDLFREAVNTHTVTLTRVARGHGFSAHLEAMKEVLREDEPLPALFRDVAWEMMHVTQTRKIKTDTSEGLMVQEGGFFMPDPESMWVHYEIKEERCIFWIQSTEGRTATYCRALERAAEKVRALLEC